MSSASFAFIRLLGLGLLGLYEGVEICEEEDASASWVQLKMEKVSPPSHFWVKRGRDASTSSNINFEVPDISKAPTWSFDNVRDEQVRHSPLIDRKKNIYLMTTTKLRKFTPSGNLTWTFELTGKMTTCPTLDKDTIFLQALTLEGLTFYALDIEDGKKIWEKHLPNYRSNLDSQGLLVTKDLLIAPIAVESEADNSWLALNTSDGAHLWDYVTDEVFWNAAPTALEDSLLFASCCGVVFRINLQGKTMWKSGTQHVPGMCGTGGGGLGENGVFYSEYNYPDGSGVFTSHVAAYQASDGKKLWQRDFGSKYLGNQYPSIGRLGPNGKLAVVVALGENPGIFPAANLDVLLNHRERYMNDAEYRRELGAKPQVNAVVALDAETGEPIWRWEERPWNHFAAAGDETVQRFGNLVEGAICLPDMQGIPVINSYDGTVYASSSHGGNLTAIRDANGDGVIGEDEIKSFAPGMAFLNSPSFAPGMIVASPCWGPSYIFLS